MLTIARTVAAVLIAVLSSGPFAVCAGWQATPEARMACCASGESCPMKHAASAGGNATLALSQSEADACCASSEPDGSTPSASTIASAITVAILGVGAVLSPPARIAGAHPASSGDPPYGATSVSRHVLLTVFLI